MASRAKELSDLGNSGHLNVHDDGTVTLEGGNIGIGTTSPDAILDVRGGAASRPTFIHASGYGGIQIAGTGASSGGALIFSNDYTNGVVEEYSIHLDGATDDLVFISGDPADIATQERMRLTDDGKLGIGTTSPGGKLTINGGQYVNNVDGPNDLVIESGDATGGGIRLTNHTNKNWFMYHGGTGSWVGDGGLGFVYSDGSAAATGPAVTFKPNGNVGIGTTDPLADLHINSGGDNLRITNTRSAAQGAQIDLLHFSSSPADEDRQAEINMGGYFSGTNSSYFTSIRSVATDVSAKQGRIDFVTRDDSDFDTVMSIAHNNKVGIGTTSPGKLLTLSRATEAQNEQLEFRNVGGISNGNFDGIRWSQGSTGGTTLAEQRINYYSTGVVDMSFNLRNEDNVLYLKAGGNVGIGTNSPNQSLEIQGDTPALRIHANNTNVAPNPKIELMRGTSNTFGGDAYSDWRIEVQNNARFYITSNDTTRGENARLIINHDTGNVNIGTDISPGYKLNVQGDLRATGTIYTNTDDIRGEGVNTGLLVGDINGTFANGYGYVELHAQDTKWNQLLHYHGGTGSSSNMWRVGSYYNSSSGDNWYRFYGKGNANKDMLKLNAAEDKIELESPMVRKTTILGSQTAPVNAGPWEHITSWAISSATATPINFNDVFNNTLFTQYKIHIHHWMSSNDNDQVYIRLLTGTNTAWALNYHYVALHHHDFSGTHSTTTYSGDNEARIWEGNWYQASGYGGISGEMTIDNVSSATVAGVNIDRGTNAYRPNLRSDMVGYNVGGVGGSPSYRRTIGYTRFNVGNNSSYWKGFQIYNSSSNNAQAGSAISVYGLKAPT